MSQPAKAQEPSMEEILASIRRIIADDDAAKPAPKPVAKAPEPPPAKPAPPPPPPAAAEPMGQDDIDAMLAGMGDNPAPEEEVLELTEAMAAPEDKPSFRHIDGEQDVVFDESPPPPSPPMMTAPSPPDHPLLSPTTSAAVNSAFGTLAHSMLVQSNRTLEDLVREMLRPMLKTWLDDNLPLMVERLVRAEIDRVSRGRPG